MCGLQNGVTSRHFLLQSMVLNPVKDSYVNESVPVHFLTFLKFSVSTLQVNAPGEVAIRNLQFVEVCFVRSVSFSNIYIIVLLSKISDL